MTTEEEGTTEQYREPLREGEFLYADVPEEAEVRESFFKRLGDITDEVLLRSPEAALLFPAHEFIEFATFFGSETDAAERVASGGSYGKVIVDGALVRLAAWIRLFKERSPIIPLDLIAIPVVELHAPAVNGASLEYSETEEIEAGFSLAVKVAGVGVGGSLKRQVKRTTSLVVSGGKCQVMLADMQSSVQFMEAPFTGKEFAILEIKGIDTLTYPDVYDKVQGVQKEHHYCQEHGAYTGTERAIAKGKLIIDRDFHSLRPGSDFKTGIEITRTRTYELDLALEGAMAVRPGPKPATVPAGASIKITSQFVRSVSAKYSLPGGHNYFGVYRGPDMLPLWWPWQAKA
ncbi:MAG: hypothetical protein ABI599_07790 [Flavobacteriales bacterium]